MKIIADENIAEVKAYFSGFGELSLLPGRAISGAMLGDVDVLLVRSITRVDQDLLRNSPCRFIGTATSGIDHIDVPWLESRGIHFAWAKACNADSVADYVCSALAALSQAEGCDWATRSIGIVGCGEVGSRLVARCLGIGMQVVVFDPFLDETHRHAGLLRDYATVLAQDIVSFHVPLTEEGRWPTRHMLGAVQLQGLSPAGILINASRGQVVDNNALLAWLVQNPEAKVVLDVWEGEPGILPGLLDRVTLATPHIAGYSLEGKLRGTLMLYEALCHFLEIPEDPVLQNPWPATLVPALARMETEVTLSDLVLAVYDIREDDRLFRDNYHPGRAQETFDALRKNYRTRREFSSFAVDGNKLSQQRRLQARALGFSVNS